MHQHHTRGEHPHLHAVDVVVPPQGEPDLQSIDDSLRRR
jgi:hypothetical protein